jgi:hypothetical protein
VVQSDDGRSAVDTLIALVALRDGPDGGYIDHRHLRRVCWRVDDHTWGTFEIERRDPFEGSPAWIIHETPSEALVIAELGRELERTDDPLHEDASGRIHFELVVDGRKVALVTDAEFTAHAGESTTFTLSPDTIARNPLADSPTEGTPVAAEP